MERMNWKQLITDLKTAGLGQEQIAQACGCSQATVSELLHSPTKQPSHPLGEALRALHRKHLRKIRVAA